MKKLLSCLLLVAVFFGLSAPMALAAEPAPIIILSTNDVHCGMARTQDEAGTITHMGYAGVAAYRAEMEALYGSDRVTLVDAGDAIQGEASGTLSEGAYSLQMMNQTGYDFAVPGNHEFDYGMENFLSLAKQAKFEYLCCNFRNQAGETVFRPYAIKDYGDIKIAYVGIATPETLTKSTPVYFQDANGNYIYSFCEKEGELYAAVQSAVDEARKAGADYVIAISHLGQNGSAQSWRSDTVIANTTGIDALLDGHSHEQYVSSSEPNRNGEAVTILQTGTKLSALGKLTIDPATDSITGELITDYRGEDSETSALLADIDAQLKSVLQTTVASTGVSLTTLSPETGQRAVRNAETNLGDLCADAYRIMLGADVGLVNGGGIRADIDAGPITYEEIINVHPYGNQLCLAEVTGAQLLDALELGARLYPQESGGFLQVSGLTYSIDPSVPSSVILSDQGAFLRVDGPRRVWNVKVNGEPLAPERLYRLASHDYMLKNGGDGFTMFQNCTILEDEVMLDNQALIRYITEKLNGVAGQEYADPKGQGRIVAEAMTDRKPENGSAQESSTAPQETPVAPEQMPASPEETPAASQESFYIVRKGDNLWKIARSYFGDGTRWRELYELNRDTIKHPDVLQIDQKLRLPKAS